MTRSSALTVLVTGKIATSPDQGGVAWIVLQYLLGLRQMQHHVYFVEPIQPGSLRPSNTPLAKSANAQYFTDVVTRFDLVSRSALLLAGTTETIGVTYGDLRRIASRADVLVNTAGMLVDDELTARIPVRLYLDVDPAFTQLWQTTQGIDMRLANHTHFATVGQRVGTADCAVPNCGVSWIPTLPPVERSYWPVGNEIEFDALTTVGHWRGYGAIEHDGTFYGQKAHSVRRFMSLPTRTAEKFTLAMAIHPGETSDLEALAANGWRLLDPAVVARTPADYERFVRGSKAEFGIAKSGYVASRCGWFSDRSAAYLASGRPVVAQDTGFGCALPIGEGLFACADIEEMLASIDAMNADYPRHSRAARAIAEEYLDASNVLRRLFARIGAA